MSEGAGNTWKTVELQELLEPGRGISYGIVQPGAEVQDGIPIVRVGDVRAGRINTQSPLRVSPTVEANYARTRLRGGELVLTLVGTVGETAIVPDELRGWNTARAVGVIPVNREVGAYWVSLALSRPEVKERINGRLNTTVQATLNLRDVAQLPIILPPPDKRLRIEQIIGTLDDKIELNRKMNETLEEMARALFKSWFVDFDPVRAKAEGRDTGLPTQIAGLFPDAFVESLLGPVPRGWNTTTWGTVATLEYGKSLSGYNTETGKYPVYGTNGRIGTCSKPLCPYPGVIIGRKGAYRGVHYSPSPFFAIDTAFYVAPKIPIELRWAYYELLRLDINSMDSGSAIPSTSREDFYSLPVVVPPHQIQRQYIKLMEPIWRQQEQNQRASAVLRHLRDTLLPKLISGEIRVSRS
jgi:type I restriction enzyme, S subunit